MTEVAPKLAATPPVSLQAGIKDFISGFDAKKIATPSGKNEAASKLALLEKDFGPKLKDKGLNLNDFYKYCSLDLSLNIIGLMCLPPINEDPTISFLRMNYLKKKFKFKELSMGMTSDYLIALKYNASYLRIGSGIFGQRK